MEERSIPAMFNAIAGRYDLNNRVLSGGFDLLWRRWAIKIANVKNGEKWLDVAAGTGDFVAAGLHFAPKSLWSAVDPAENMLEILKARSELKDVKTYHCGAEELPFKDNTFRGTTIAFGLRNFADKKKGLREINRVLLPDGKIVILEFLPRKNDTWGGPKLVSFYLNKILPIIGGFISGDKDAYNYLNNSSRQFWSAGKLTFELEQAGFINVTHWSIMAGAVTLTLARKKD